MTGTELRLDREWPAGQPRGMTKRLQDVLALE